jgi:putative transposase
VTPAQSSPSGLKVWASDYTLTATADEGQLTVFEAVDHCTIECVGATTNAAAGIRNRIRPRQPVRERQPSGRNCLPGMESSPLVRQLERNGCIERFIRTIKGAVAVGALFQNVERLRRALAEFRER